MFSAMAATQGSVELKKIASETSEQRLS